jgi:choline-sulfatase
MDNKNNILVILCDQLRIDILKCYGGNLVRTPNIDSLCKESVIFEKAYTPTAICSPARASLMTGLYPHGHHMFNNSTPTYSYCEHLRPDITMIQDWADSETNYETAYFGKWHIGNAQDLFNSRFHNTHPKPYENGPTFLATSHWHPNKTLGPLVKDVYNGLAGELDIPIEEFSDVVAVNYTREFLKNREFERPFLAFCSLPGPHSPWLVPKEFGVRYESDEICLWNNLKDNLQGKPLYQKKLRFMGIANGIEISDDNKLKQISPEAEDELYSVLKRELCE